MQDKNLFQYKFRELNEKVAFFSKETNDFQVLGNTLIIASYKAIELSIFHKLAVKLWLTEDDDFNIEIIV